MDHNHPHQFLPPQQHYDQSEYPRAPPGRPQDSSYSGRKRSADQLEDDDSLGPGDDGLEGDVKDEDSPAGTSNSSGANKLGNQQRKNRSSAPALKRGTACMLCRKRKLVSLSYSSDELTRGRKLMTSDMRVLHFSAAMESDQSVELVID
jgi:hypothetical protein